MKVKTSKKMSRGQGMVEYLILVALLAIAAIATTQYFGSALRQTMAAIGEEMAGRDGTATQGRADKAARDGATEAARDKTMGTFVGNANQN